MQFTSTPLGRSHIDLQLQSVTKHTASGYSGHEALEHGSVGHTTGEVIFFTSNGWMFLHAATLPKESRNTGSSFPHFVTTVQNESSTPSHERSAQGFVGSKLKSLTVLFTEAVVRLLCSDLFISLLFTESGLPFERFNNATAKITENTIPEDSFISKAKSTNCDCCCVLLVLIS